jgi:hypothetical protein
MNRSVCHFLENEKEEKKRENKVWETYSKCSISLREKEKKYWKQNENIYIYE